MLTPTYSSYLLKNTTGYSLKEVASQNIVIQEKRRRGEEEKRPG